MKRSSLLPSKSRPIVKFEEEASEAEHHVQQGFTLSCFCSCSSHHWTFGSSRFVLLSDSSNTNTMNQKPKPNREVGRNSSFWECTTVGSCPSCHSYQSMDDDFVWCKKCHDAVKKHQILVASLHKSDRSFQPLTTKKYLHLQRVLSTFE